MSTQKKVYNFGEKQEEYSAKHNKKLPVWKSPKYEEAKKKAIELLESKEYKDVLSESDFWILMNATKNEQMAYTGLIISHNGCLKINDVLPDELKFNPRAVTMHYGPVDNQSTEPTYKNSLLFVYDSSRLDGYDEEETEDKQHIFEVGEVNERNCTNEYPYAMALKRCMDRVILKNSKLAYSGIYSDSEAEEFKEPIEDKIEDSGDKVVLNQNNGVPLTLTSLATNNQKELIKNLYKEKVDELKELLKVMGKTKIDELTIHEASELISREKE